MLAPAGNALFGEDATEDEPGEKLFSTAEPRILGNEPHRTLLPNGACGCLYRFEVPFQVLRKRADSAGSN